MSTHARVIALLASVLALSACAKTQVTERQVLYQGKLARPNHIFVYDFAATPEDVPSDSALAGHPSVASAPQTPEQIALGREVGAELAKALVADIVAMGLPAEHGTSESALGVGDLVIRGYLLSVEAGSAAERVTIGMGKGNAELKTAVEGFLVTDQGLRKLGSGSLDSDDSKTPGAAVPLAVALATKNPLGLVVSTGVKLHSEETGSSTIQGKARETAQAIAEQIKPHFQEQGWIP
jgi:hypothetical protein